MQLTSHSLKTELNSVSHLFKRLSDPFLNHVAEKRLEEMIEEIFSGTLKTLSLEEMPVTDRDLAVLLSHCPELTSCDLSGCVLLTDRGIAQIPGFVERLEILSLRKVIRMRGTCFESLSRLRNLRSLDLSENFFKGKHLEKIALCEKLSHLYLWRCGQLRDRHLDLIANKTLKHLDVSYCPGLTDRTFVRLTHVQKIDLDGNFITERGLATLITHSDHESTALSLSTERCTWLSTGLSKDKIISKL